VHRLEGDIILPSFCVSILNETSALIWKQRTYCMHAQQLPSVDGSVLASCTACFHNDDAESAVWRSSCISATCC